VKDTDLNTHVRVFKKAIKVVEADIINLFGFILRDNISKWGENFIQYHINYTFDEFEQAFCKCCQTMKNDKEVYMKLRNF
jgi:hypothetical protein